MNKKLFIILAALIVLAGIGLYRHYSSAPTTPSSAPTRTDIKVVLYTKDGCRYCNLTKELLQDKGIPYELVELTGNKDIFIKLANQTGQNTVPYVFVNGQFVGGYQDLLHLSETGKL